MAEIKVLIEGYAKEEKDVELASSTTVLIKENNLNIIVDPGMNRKLLIDNLKKENLSILDINYVILTHHHLDHILLAGIFKNAKVFDNNEIYSWDGKIKEHNGNIPSTSIKIIKTLGHGVFPCSILVNTKDLGKVVIAGDIFWWFDKETQKNDRESLIEHKDPYARKGNYIKESRIKLLDIADWIIPGHGKMFKSPKV
jgi:glyoxylase-like metal-dependent hydrolase (beta-lactamase superfamily II)